MTNPRFTIENLMKYHTTRIEIEEGRRERWMDKLNLAIDAGDDEKRLRVSRDVENLNDRVRFHRRSLRLLEKLREGAPDAAIDY